LKRLVSILVFAAVSYWLAAPVFAAGGNCTSIEAKCAVEIGGICDPSTSRWSYGHVRGHVYGGNTGAFTACLERNGLSRAGAGRLAAAAAAQAHRHARVPTSAATAGKCNSIQAQCAVEIGGQCDPKTGSWCYGFNRNRECGGTNHGGAYDACLSRKLGERR
jgi:hypothetical protein